MSKSNNTLCIRCGKERILSKTWEEHIGDSLITYSLFVCPDTSCQKIVDKKLKEKRNHMETIQAKSLIRRKENNKRNKKFKKRARDI